jgi:hypothetical protein
MGFEKLKRFCRRLSESRELVWDDNCPASGVGPALFPPERQFQAEKDFSLLFFGASGNSLLN